MAPLVTAYRLFDLSLARRTQLSHCLSRLTFTGPEVGKMATYAPDQRVKLLFPDSKGRPSALPHQPDWLAIRRAMPVADRPPMRTYTIRLLRPEQGEVDIDFVLHGDEGPATRWALNAAIGDTVQIVAPDRTFPGQAGGYEWKPAPGTKHVLLIGDETALPAIAGILDELAVLPAPPTVQAFIEVPEARDVMELPRWPGLEVEWMPRADTGEAQPMVAALQRARLPAMKVDTQAETLEMIDLDKKIVWHRAAPVDDGFYAWIAGEASSVLAIRHHLINERGVDRRALNLMGYWRRGQSVDDRAA